MKARNYFIFIFLVAVDQLVKYIIRAKGGFYICNSNIAFGIKLPGATFYFLWIVIILFILFLLYKKYFRQNVIYAIFILAGAISNFIDRLFFKCVIDFIDLKFWPVFNLADIFITIGIIFLIFGFSKIKDKK